MQFSNIIGQQNIKAHLINTVRENRISHAQLFFGAEGYGTLPLALAYAQYINCQSPTETDSCGACSSCRRIAKLQHPDLHFVFPVIGDKAVSDQFIQKWRDFILANPYGNYNQWLDALDAGNAQGIIRVDEGREILRKLSMKSFEADYKTMIIWFPEKMNPETANKLLKLIEEPPEKTLFLLVAENTGFMLSTILSRTQLVKVPRISEDDLFIGLKERLNLNDAKARLISRMSEGNYNLAVEYNESSLDARQNFELFTQLMRLSYAGKFPEIIRWVDEISKLGREKQKGFLTYGLRLIRENLILNQKQPHLARLSDEEKDFATRFSAFIHPDNAPMISIEFDKAHLHILRNANPKILFLDLCIKLNQLLRA